MKITIPEEYRSGFGSEPIWIMPKTRRTLLHPFGGKASCIVQELTFVFVTRWEGRSLLLMNGEERALLIRGVKNTDGSLKVVAKKDIVPIMLADGAVEIPEALAEWLGEGEISFEKADEGLRLFGW